LPSANMFRFIIIMKVLFKIGDFGGMRVYTEFFTMHYNYNK